MNTNEPNEDLLPLLLGICEDFFTGASPAAHRNVDALLQARGITGGPGWLIDMLALTRQHLETRPNPPKSSLWEAPDPHESGARTDQH